MYDESSVCAAYTDVYRVSRVKTEINTCTRYDLAALPDPGRYRTTLRKTVLETRWERKVRRPQPRKHHERVVSKSGCFPSELPALAVRKNAQLKTLPVQAVHSTSRLDNNDRILY